MAQLKLENIYKTYDKKVNAVTDFNLEISDQEFIVFVGPSGCGKSTTLRMIAGLEEISSGDFYIDDVRMNDVSPKDRDIAKVFQNYALYPHMTVFENMAFGLKIRKLPKQEIKERVNNAAKILGLEEYLSRTPKALSGGQRQRVALGRAIVRDAKVFLMDEPLSNLDAKLRVQMRSEIIKLHKRLKTTTIYVTHDQTEAMTMATRIVIMKDGFIQQVGSPKEVYNFPVNMFVAGFIGSPAMNFFTVEVLEEGIRLGNQTIPVPSDKLKVLHNMGYKGKSVVLGIRPEQFKDEATNESYETMIPVTVEVAELMGAEINVYASIQEESFVAKISAAKEVVADDVISLFVDMEKVHFFDAESEMRIDFINKEQSKSERDSVFV